MKLRALLILSVALNLYFAFTSRRARPQTEPAAEPRPTPAVRAYTGAETNTVPPRFNWQSVEADDYEVYIANLRAIGCPEETIQDIVIADVFKLFEEKKRQLRATAAPIPYWKTNSRFRGDLQFDAAELDRKICQPVNQERDALLRTLGIDVAAAKMPASKLDARELLLDFLSKEKRRHVVELYRRIDEERQSLTGDELRRRYITFQDDLRVKELLTPEEAFQYDLRFSNTANTMRHSLQGFDPTETEFIEIFKLRKVFSDALASGLPSEKASAAEDALNEQLKNLLGEARFQDYDRTTDFGFQQIWKVTERLGKPTSTAIAAFETQRAAMGKAYELRQSNMDKDQLKATLDSLRTATEESLQSILGPEAWEEHSRGFTFVNSLNAISPRN
jgi:hypothetical protein